MNKNVPNILTGIRLVMVPLTVFLWFYTALGEKRFLLAAAVFAAASVTDFLDGYLARKNECVSSFGKIADPIADKALTIAALLCILIYTKSVIGIVFAVLIILREVTVSVMRMIYVKKGIVLAAGIPGKIKTVFQMFGLLACMIIIYFSEHSAQSGINVVPVTNIIIGISMFLTVFSGIWCFVNAKAEKNN